jgi:hypothetical protein
MKTFVTKETLSSVRRRRPCGLSIGFSLAFMWLKSCSGPKPEILILAGPRGGSVHGRFDHLRTACLMGGGQWPLSASSGGKWRLGPVVMTIIFPMNSFKHLLLLILTMSRCRHGREPLSRIPKEHMLREVDALARAELDILVEGMAHAWKIRPPPSATIAAFASRAFSDPRSPFARAFMSKHLCGIPLIDLGAADPLAMAEFAHAHGARGYIAVDRFYDYSGMQAPPGAELINEDMLRFVSYRPDSSANVCMNAIDEIVLMSPDGAVEAAYVLRLMGEIARVVPPGGLAFGLSSPHLHLLENAGFERIMDISGESVTDAGAIYRKAVK